MFRGAEKSHGGFAYGLYDIYSNIGYITLWTSGDTSEFGCACIRNWWTTHGKSEFLFETGRKTADGFKENMKYENSIRRVSAEVELCRCSVRTALNPVVI
ncbi:MAG: ISAzo13-like element transposase-related protein [Candidatus Electrothrix sp. YB6]